MKVIIAGSRDLPNEVRLDLDTRGCMAIWQYLVFRAYDLSNIHATEIVSGGARGADSAGLLLAAKKNLPIKMFYPDWSVGKSAGPIRNARMADYADALIALWDMKSRGTSNMIELAQKKGLKVFIYEL